MIAKPGNKTHTSPWPDPYVSVAARYHVSDSEGPLDKKIITGSGKGLKQNWWQAMLYMSAGLKELMIAWWILSKSITMAWHRKCVNSTTIMNVTNVTIWDIWHLLWQIWHCSLKDILITSVSYKVIIYTTIEYYLCKFIIKQKYGDLNSYSIYPPKTPFWSNLLNLCSARHNLTGLVQFYWPCSTIAFYFNPWMYW